MDKTQPLGSGTLSTGSVVLRGRKENLHPKERALWLKKDAVTIGLNGTTTASSYLHDFFLESLPSPPFNMPVEQLWRVHVRHDAPAGVVIVDGHGVDETRLDHPGLLERRNHQVEDPLRDGVALPAREKLLRSGPGGATRVLLVLLLLLLRPSRDAQLLAVDVSLAEEVSLRNTIRVHG